MRKLIIPILFLFSLNTFSQVDTAFAEYGHRPFVSADGNDTIFIHFDGDSTSIYSNEGLDIDNVLNIDYNDEGLVPGYKRGRRYYDTVRGTFNAYVNSPNVTLNEGQELWVYGRNSTNDTIKNGEVVWVDSCSTCPYVNFKPSIATDPIIASATIAVATEDIPGGELGYFTRFGLVGINTSMYNEGQLLYVSPYDSGQLVGYAPESPYYKIRVGRVINKGVNGDLGVDVEPFTGNDTEVAIDGILNGIILEKPSISDTIISNVLYFETHNELRDTIDLPYMYQKQIWQLNTTTNTGTDGKARIALSYGTESSPQKNYIYIDHNGGSPQLAISTTAFPENGVRLAECSVFDQTTHESYGFAQFQRWNNSIDGSMADGWVNKSAKNSRLAGTRWYSGVNQTIDIVTNASAVDSVNFYTTSGVVPQFNFQNFDESQEKKYYWYNAPGGGQWISDLNEINQTADGTSVRTHNSYYSINIFGVQNSGNFLDYLMVAVSTSKYSSTQEAIDNTDNYAVTTVPDEFRYTAFRIARIVLQYTIPGNGTITNLLGAGEYQDERGQLLGIGGAGGGSGTISYPQSDAAWSLSNNADPTKLGNFDLSGITTGTTRTLTWPDASGTIAIYSDLIENNTTINYIPYWDGNSLENSVLKYFGGTSLTLDNSNLRMDDDNFIFWENSSNARISGNSSTGVLNYVASSKHEFDGGNFEIGNNLTSFTFALNDTNFNAKDLGFNLNSLNDDGIVFSDANGNPFSSDKFTFDSSAFELKLNYDPTVVFTSSPAYYYFGELQNQVRIRDNTNGELVRYSLSEDYITFVMDDLTAPQGYSGTFQMDRPLEKTYIRSRNIDGSVLSQAEFHPDKIELYVGTGTGIESDELTFLTDVDSAYFEKILSVNEGIKFSDGTTQTTAGGASSSGTQYRIQYSDGSGGFSNDNDFYYQTDVMYFGSGGGISGTGSNSPNIDAQTSFTENVTYTWNGTGSSNCGIANPASGEMALKAGSATIRLKNTGGLIEFEPSGGGVDYVVISETKTEFNHYIEADSAVFLNNNYSDFVFEDNYKPGNIYKHVIYAKKHGHLKGMPRRDSINPISYINKLEEKIEVLYLLLFRLNLIIVGLITFMIFIIIYKRFK